MSLLLHFCFSEKKGPAGFSGPPETRSQFENAHVFLLLCRHVKYGNFCKAVHGLCRVRSDAFIPYLSFSAATLGLCPRRKQIFFDLYSYSMSLPKHTHIHTLGNKSMIFLKLREYLKMVKI